MKNLVITMALAAFPLVSFAAGTGDVCTGGASAKVNITAGTGEFVKRNFAAQCSANVNLGYSQSATALAVASGSVKGKTYYHGSSEGGAVTRESDCAATGCGTGSLVTKASAKLAASAAST